MQPQLSNNFSFHTVINIKSLRSISSHTDAAALLQPCEGAWDRQEKEQLHHRAAGEGVWSGRLGLPELRPGADQQQWAVPGDGVRWQHPGRLLPGRLVQPSVGLSFPGGRHGDWWVVVASDKCHKMCHECGFDLICVSFSFFNFLFSLEEIQVPKNRALQIQAELTEQTQ